MQAICQISITSTTTSQQISKIGIILERWSDRQTSRNSCCCKLEGISLADIKGGEFPKPETLRRSESFRKIQRIRRAIGLEEINLGPARRNGSGKEAETKVVMVRLSYNSKLGHESAAEELRKMLPDSLVAEISVMETKAGKNNLDDFDDEEIDDSMARESVLDY